MKLARTLIPACALALAAFIGTAPAAAKGFTILHNFCAKRRCADGAMPYAGLIADTAGNLYGTTIGGGRRSSGTVFKVSPTGTETVLYSFCPHAPNCADGQYPYSDLIRDQSGNFYGTTRYGGAKHGGVVFKLAPDGAETVLHPFCRQANCTDGNGPVAGLILSGTILYGTAENGGVNNLGVVFKVTTSGAYHLLYTFCKIANCADGAQPEGTLLLSKGYLVGTTAIGGAYDQGTAFKLKPTKEARTLYSFCTQESCVDGANPVSGAIADGSGNFYGTTFYGGTGNENTCGLTNNVGCGTVFEITPEGAEKVLYSFCSMSACADGAYPNGSLVWDAAGNLYGTTYQGGVGNCGTVFKLAPNGTETVLYSFNSGEENGCYPEGKLIKVKGYLYGTASSGGANGGGIVFKLSTNGG